MPGKEGGKAKPLKVADFCAAMLAILHPSLKRTHHVSFLCLQKPKTNKEELDDDDKAFLAKKKAEQAAIKELQKTAAAKGGFAKNKGGK